MSEHEEDRRPWFWIGFRFGLGFWLAASIFSAIGGVLAWLALTHQIELEQRAFQKTMREITGKHSQPAQQRPRSPEVIRIPPQSVEACKELTGGQINEEFAKCRSGYTETR